MAAIAIYKGVPTTITITVPDSYEDSELLPVLVVNTREDDSFSGQTVMQLTGGTISEGRSVIDISATDSDIDSRTYFFNAVLDSKVIDAGTITVLPTVLAN